MKLLPAQIALRLICGHSLPMGMRDKTREQIIREGQSYAAWLDAVAEEMLHRRFTLGKWGGIHPRKRLT